MAKKRTTKKTSSESEKQQVAPEKSADARSSFPLVGIGASAGGLKAFEEFFTQMSPDSGMAFVIVQHLDPTHKSILTDLLKKYTRMPVVQVEDNMTVEPNAVYVIPPNRDMALQGNELHLMKPTMPRGLRLPIDLFFRSLAVEQKERAICIVLSGTGTDGTLGLKAIKGEGGLTIVQSPESARYDGMPISAVNTGLVDVVLPPEKIAEQLIDYVQRSFGAEPLHPRKLLPGISDNIQNIFVLLRDHTGHDFSGYKENTITRRIERRMTVNQLAQVEDYLHYLQRTPLEIEILFRELLIGVTSFFRDPEAFEHLDKKVIAPLFTQKREHPRQIRVWVPGCSTGEEAYSIAMLLQEQMDNLKLDLDVQVFATDIDQNSIEKAREGRYPDSIAADVSPERLQRFFKKEEESNHYQVKRQIRDMVVFAVQSVIKDPPFSKLDLLCCRNLMIYLGTELQQRLLSLFHYALNPGGFLFLGNSETLGTSQRYFHTIDQKWRIFQKAQINTDIKTILEFPSTYVKHDLTQNVLQTDRQMSVREFTEQMLLAEYTPTSIVINEKGEVLYVHGRTGKYLEQTTGEVSTNILKMAREGLRMSLSTAIRKVNTHKKPHVIEGIKVRTNGDEIRIKLTVAPVVKPVSMQGLMLVIFNEIGSPRPVSDEEKTEVVGSEQTQHVLELEQELKSTREYLQTMIEELETTNEELKSSNEELQSSNEELQSTNEELQTSKEELQSVNEELVTVNSELQAKVDELTFANNDIKNLMESTQVGIIFLDTNLRIRRFTDASKKIVELIPEDTGRPLKQFVHKLRHENLIKDAQEVLENQMPKEVEVQSEDNQWYLLRILPYRTVDDQIAGVVLTLANVTQIKQAEDALRQSEARYQAAIHHSSLIFAQVDRELRYTWIHNPHPDFDPELVIGKRDDELNDNAGTLQLMQLKQEVLETGRGLRREIGFPLSNGWLTYEVIAEPLRDTADQVVGVATCSLDITGWIQAEEALRKSEEKFKAVASNTPDHILMQDLELRYEFVVNPQLGLTEQDMLGKTDHDFMVPEDADNLTRIKKQVLESGQPFSLEVPVRLQDGQQGYFEGAFIPRFSAAGKISGLIGYFKNVTKRKQVEESLRESEEKFRFVLTNSMDAAYRRNLQTDRYDYMSPVIQTILGWSAEEMNQMDIKTALANVHPDDQPGVAEELERTDALCKTEGRATGMLEYRFQDPAGAYHWVSDAITVLSDEKGQPLYRLGIIRDVTQQKQAEKNLKQALEDKEVLLRELSHRTKNNMHVINSMLSLQAEFTQNEEVKRIVKETGNKIYAMALVHQKLYQTESLSHIDLQGYLEELISAVTRSYTIDPDHISVTVKTEPVQVLIDTAIPCGLVVTELISNAFKHAFPDDKKGKISIQLSKDAKENIHLRILDNGVGVPDGFDFRKQPSLGMKTVLMIVEHQLKGTITFDVKRGVKYDIRFADILREVRI